MPEITISITLEIKNQKVREEIEEILSSLKGFQISNKSVLPPNNESRDLLLQELARKSPQSREGRKSAVTQENGSCDLLIQEIGDNPQEELHIASALQTSGIVRDIFLTSSLISQEVLIEALKIGVRGFFPQPINREEVKAALLKLKGLKEQEKTARTPVKRGKIIDVFGCKGGVGTTTVAVNLAASLAGQENSPSVVLIDMNRFLGEMPLMLNIEPVFDWVRVTKNISRLDETYLMSILSKHPSGIHVLPSPVELIDDHPVNPQSLETLLKLMQKTFDFVVIDGGRCLVDTARMLMKISDTVLLVCELNLPCIVNLKKLQDTFRKYGYPLQENTEIVVNRFSKFPEISQAELEESVKRKALCYIPNAYRISMNAINQGKPFSMMAQGSAIHKKFGELASFFQEKKAEKKEKGLFSLTSIFSQKKT
jgi:pilus assembly protein CpaE